MTHPPIEPELNPEEYRPEGLRDWKVGDEVAWHISAECPYRCEKCGINFHFMDCAECKTSKRGTVVYIGQRTKRVPVNHGKVIGSKCNGSSVGHNNHNYFVELHSVSPNECRGFWAAASELIPLEVEG